MKTRSFLMSVLALVLALSAASCGGDALQNANQTETPETIRDVPALAGV